MKPFRRLAFLCLLTLLLGSCQKDLLHWQLAQQLDTHGAHRLNNIRFLNDTLGICVGGERFNSAEILLTRDGGYTWSLQSFPQAGKELFGLAISPGGAIYTCAFDGKLLWSADGGKHWNFRQITYRPYKTLAFSGPARLLIGGGVSFEMGYLEGLDTQGNSRAYEEYDYEVNDISLLPDGTGYMAGYGVMRKTTDSGYHWTLQELNQDNFTALDVHDAQTAWTCGYNGSIYRTRDGGAHWECLRNGNDITKPRYQLQDILFPDDQHGYAVGENGLVLYSDDGGLHWMELDRFTTSHLRCLEACPNGDLLICGDNGTLYRLRR